MAGDEVERRFKHRADVPHAVGAAQVPRPQTLERRSTGGPSSAPVVVGPARRSRTNRIHPLTDTVAAAGINSPRATGTPSVDPRSRGYPKEPSARRWPSGAPGADRVGTAGRGVVSPDRERERHHEQAEGQGHRHPVEINGRRPDWVALAAAASSSRTSMASSERATSASKGWCSSCPALGLANLTAHHPRLSVQLATCFEQLSFTSRGNDRDLPVSGSEARRSCTGRCRPRSRTSRRRAGTANEACSSNDVPRSRDRDRGDADGSVGDRSALDDRGSLRDVEVERSAIEQILLRGGHVPLGARRLTRQVVGSIEDEVGAAVGRGGGGPGQRHPRRSSRRRSIGVCACGPPRSGHATEQTAGGRAVPGTLRPEGVVVTKAGRTGRARTGRTGGRRCGRGWSWVCPWWPSRRRRVHARRAGGRRRQRSGASGDPAAGHAGRPARRRGPERVDAVRTPGAVASLGGSWLSSATRAAGSTLLQTVDGSDAEPASAVRLDGSLDVRVVSESGGSVALMDPLPDGWDPEVPLPRSRTQIVVADPTGSPRPAPTTCAGTSSPRPSRPTTGGCS